MVAAGSRATRVPRGGGESRGRSDGKIRTAKAVAFLSWAVEKRYARGPVGRR